MAQPPASGCLRDMIRSAVNRKVGALRHEKSFTRNIWRHFAYIEGKSAAVLCPLKELPTGSRLKRIPRSLNSAMNE